MGDRVEFKERRVGRRLQEEVMAGPQGKLPALHFFLGLDRPERYVLAFGM